jgi:hypothetical protein
MIKRFEDEFPETRLQSASDLPPSTGTEPETSPVGSVELTNITEDQSSDNEQALIEDHLSDDGFTVRPVLSRHNSDVSIASRALSQEEGRMHRFGQKFRRDIINAEGPERQPRTAADEEHLQLLRATVEGLDGAEIQRRLEAGGPDTALEELSNEASELRRQFIEADPENWKKFVESQEAAQRNLAAQSRARSSSDAVE